MKIPHSGIHFCAVIKCLCGLGQVNYHWDFPEGWTKKQVPAN